MTQFHHFVLLDVRLILIRTRFYYLYNIFIFINYSGTGQNNRL
jgi:hypothetical protein